METWKIVYIVLVSLMGLLLAIKVGGLIVLTIWYYYQDKRTRRT